MPYELWTEATFKELDAKASKLRTILQKLAGAAAAAEYGGLYLQADTIASKLADVFARSGAIHKALTTEKFLNKQIEEHENALAKKRQK